MNERGLLIGVLVVVDEKVVMRFGRSKVCCDGVFSGRRGEGDRGQYINKTLPVVCR